MAESFFEFGPVEQLAVGTVGEPGNRTFFLQVTGGGRTLNVKCEKAHVQNLIGRVRELADAAALEPTPLYPPGHFSEPAQVDWLAIDLGVAYHQGRREFVMVARGQGEGEGESALRIWASPAQMLALAAQAEHIVSQGRPNCNICGLPIDPAGHPCPAANGSRPIF